MKKIFKNIALILISGLVLNGCAKREDDKNYIINTESEASDTDIVLTWNNKEIEERIGDEEGFSIKARVEVYNNKLYTGKIKKELPSKELIEKVFCDNKKMTDVTDIYINHDLPDEEVSYYYAIFDEKNENILQMYSFDNMSGEYQNLKYDNVHFDFLGEKASDADANSNEIVRCEELMKALEMNVIVSKYYGKNSNGKKLGEIYFYNSLEDVPVIDLHLGVEYTSIKIVDSEIADIRLAPNYTFIEDKKNVDSVLSPEQIIKIIRTEYDNGNITIIPDCTVDKIKLVYLEETKGEVVPVWLFTTYYGDMDNIIFVYNALDGTKLYDVMEGFITK